MEAAPALPPGSMGFPGRPVSGLPVPSLSRVYFPGGLEWPSCVKEYPSLLQSRKSASYQTLRMWIAGPHRRPPHLGPFVSSSKDSLHQPERASSSSVRAEGLRTSVGRPVGHSVLRQHHHSSVCQSPAAIHHALVLCHSGRSQSSHILIGPEWTLNQDIVLRLFRSDSPHGGRLLRLRSDSPHGGHLRLPRSDSPQRGHPHLSEWDSLQTQGLAPPGDPFLGIHALQGHAPPGIPSLQREVPLPLNDDAMSWETPSLLINITHLDLELFSDVPIVLSDQIDPLRQTLSTAWIRSACTSADYVATINRFARQPGFS